MSRRVCFFVALAVAGAAAAQAPRTAPDMATVTVHGARDPKKLNDEIDGFVGAITHGARTDGIARWYVPVCPLVAGLPLDQAELLLQRISDAARFAEAPLAPEKCSPNLVVVATTSPHELLERWSDKSPSLFNTRRGPFAVKRFMNSTQPVRTWYNSGDSCGERMASFQIQADILSVACRTSGMASRLSRTSVRVVSSAIVVVDKTQMSGLKVGQVADYVAMVALAEFVEPTALLPVPSVLNMFLDGAEPRPAGMSDWDKSFLHALYHSNPRNVGQVSEIRLEMFRTAVAAEPAQ